MFQALIEALEEEDAYVRGTVASWLGRMASGVGDQPTVEAVIQALERKVQYMDFYQRNFDNVEMAAL